VWPGRGSESGGVRFRQEVRERPAQVAGVHRPTELVGEDESDRVVPLSMSEAFGCVPSGVPPKRTQGGLGKLQLASRPGGLRLADGWGAAPWPVQRAGNSKPACRQVDIAPAQREQLALAHYPWSQRGRTAPPGDRSAAMSSNARTWPGSRVRISWCARRGGCTSAAGLREMKPPARCLTERLVEDFVQMADGGRAQTGVHAVEVEPLDVGRLQLGEAATADEWKDVRRRWRSYAHQVWLGSSTLSRQATQRDTRRPSVARLGWGSPSS